MNPKILVFGMHRSGTTLLADLLRRHPQVRHVFHESVILQFDPRTLFAAKTLPDHELIQDHGELWRASNVRRVDFRPDFDLATSTWGAKMSYPGPVILQEWRGSALDYAITWLRHFGNEARILHLVRHPFDVFASASRRWADHDRHRDNYGKLTLDRLCRDWCHALDTLLPALSGDSRVQTLRFETLLTEPEDTLSDAFSSTGLNTDEGLIKRILSSDLVFFGKVRPDRAYQYRDRVDSSRLCQSTRCLLSPHFARFDYETT
jgi:hypothetical protein